jgi:DNA-binding CsgD family transcriptional regulator
METFHPLVENERVHFLLEKIVNCLITDPVLRQDLMQEALLHLWRLERERPGQKLSWYLQSCRFRLQHYLSAGRSLDAEKRRRAQVPLAQDDHESTAALEQMETSDHSFGETCTHDLLSTLTGCLKARECDVLHCLADGLPTADIARRLQLSCPTVTKYRRKIARLVVKLGLRAAPSTFLPPSGQTPRRLLSLTAPPRDAVPPARSGSLRPPRKQTLKSIGSRLAKASATSLSCSSRRRFDGSGGERSTRQG